MVPVRRVMVLGGVGVTGEAQHLPSRQQVEERGAIDGRAVGIVRRGVGEQRDVHGEHDQVVPWNLGQKIAQKGQAALADVAAIGVSSDRHRRTQPLDVVEHHEPGPPVAERVGRRTEDPLPGLAAIAGVRSLHVEVVIAREAVPGQADLPDDAV